MFLFLNFKFSQVKGVEYDEVSRYTSVRSSLALANTHDSKMDVKISN